MLMRFFSEFDSGWNVSWVQCTMPCRKSKVVDICYVAIGACTVEKGKHVDKESRIGKTDWAHTQGAFMRNGSRRTPKMHTHVTSQECTNITHGTWW